MSGDALVWPIATEFVMGQRPASSRLRSMTRQRARAAAACFVARSGSSPP